MTEINKYSRGQIYTIRNYKDESLIYVGSTVCLLHKRLCSHKSLCKGGNKQVSLYKYIIDNDWGDWYIELHEDYPCNNKKELNRREGEVVREIGTINKNVAGRNNKEYYTDNRERILEYQKRYNTDNRERRLEYQQSYNADNRERISKYHKGYYTDTRERRLEYQKTYNADNCERISEYHKQYYARKRSLTP